MSAGIGGIFFRARDPKALKRWYHEHVGLPLEEPVRAEGIIVWGPFSEDTDYFGERSQQSMINYRVDDLDAVLERLRAAGARVDDEQTTMEGLGRFGWAWDPEGNRFELWEPVEGT
jgi:predicted enzyme related to lactoylglutathione lyase